MSNLVEVNYARTGRSTNTDALGMREMQALRPIQSYTQITESNFSSWTDYPLEKLVTTTQGNCRIDWSTQG